jgi:hypothetical protein
VRLESLAQVREPDPVRGAEDFDADGDPHLVDVDHAIVVDHDRR